MRILIVTNEDVDTAMIAKGWFYKFEPDIDVHICNTESNKTASSSAIKLMKENGIDISLYKCDDLDKSLSENWDFVISVAGDELLSNLCFSGKTVKRYSVQLPYPEEETGDKAHKKEIYEQTIDDVRVMMFDFYLKEIKEKDILGADSCGAECDL